MALHFANPVATCKAFCANFGALSRNSLISDFSYSGTELDAVAEATNYYDWVVGSFTGAFGKRVVEAGAGIGTVSQLILDRAAPKELLLVEPARNNVPALRRRFSGDPRVRIVEGYLEEIGRSSTADTVIAINVMEHIARDADFLRAAFRTLSGDGTLLLLVPAVPAIYGSLDRAFDHYRRYSKSGLRNLLLDAGFQIERLDYLNLIGVIAWFFSGVILRRKTLSRSQVRFYDRFVIPWLRAFESRIHPPIGQSLLVIARKPATRVAR